MNTAQCTDRYFQLITGVLVTSILWKRRTQRCLVKPTVVNLAFPSLHGGSLEITLTVHFKIKYSPDYVPREECNKNVINSGNKNESQRGGLLENRSIVENSEG